jgi:hypothetical protein
MSHKQVKNLHIDTVYEIFIIKRLLKFLDFYIAYIVLQGLPSYLISGPRLLCLHYSDIHWIYVRYTSKTACWPTLGSPFIVKPLCIV